VHHRIVLGLLGEFGASGPTCDAGGGAEPSSTPITDRIAIELSDPDRPASCSQALSTFRRRRIG